MKFVTLDTEQEAMLEMAFAGMDAFLEARARRRDPGGFISRGAQLQRRKVTNIRRQLAMGAVCQFHEMEPRAQNDIVRLAAKIATAETVHMRSILLSQLINIALYQRQPPVDDGLTIAGQIEGAKT